MRRKTLLTLALASAIALAGCTQREVTKVDPLNIPIEETEPVKPAEPIVINVVPELEVEDSDNNIEISADIDFYGKDEATQPAPSTPNSGFPATSNPTDEKTDYSQPSSFAQPAGNGVPYTDRFGGYHTGNTQPNSAYTGGTW